MHEQVVTASDMALSALGSWDPVTDEHTSDHMPVVGTMVIPMVRSES